MEIFIISISFIFLCFITGIACYKLGFRNGSAQEFSLLKILMLYDPKSFYNFIKSIHPYKLTEKEISDAESFYNDLKSLDLMKYDF